MKKKNVLVITYWDYDDPLIQTYTLPYLKIISKYINKGCILLVLQQKKMLAKSYEEKINKELSAYGIRIIQLHYLPFSIHAFVRWAKNILFLLSLLNRYTITHIHCWCTPAGMIGYLLSKLSGTPLIIDSYEPHAETMIENGTWKKNSFSGKLLFYFEKLQTKRAKEVIAATSEMKEYAASRYNYVPINFYVKPACVNLEAFSAVNRKNEPLLKKYELEDKIICVYAGKFGGIYLDREVFDFFKIAQLHWKEKFRVLLLTSHSKKIIQAYCHAAGLNENIITQLFVPHNEIANYIGLGDFAITPVKPVPTKQYCSPIKNGEYWALGLPVVITSNISEDSNLINRYDAGSILESFNHECYLKSVKQIDLLLNSLTKEDLYKRIRYIAEKHRNFIIAEKVYKAIYGT